MDKLKELYGLFTSLKLKAFKEHYERVCKKKSVEEILLELCRLEMEKRYDSKIKTRIRSAFFPKIKTLEMLDYNLAPRLPKETVETLSTCEFIKQNHNVLLLGDSGGGKTHLAIALGIEACKQSHSVRFHSACGLVNTLQQEYKEGNIEKYLTKLRKYPLLIIDELGYVPFAKKGAELLFQVFSQRYEAGSVVVTSNLNFSNWTEVFGDKTMTNALLDRLVHKATIIKYDWGSIRFNQALQTQEKSTTL